jgi:hypothetical protein
MPWRAELTDERIDLGAGKRQVAVGGSLDRRYDITVPRETNCPNGSRRGS